MHYPQRRGSECSAWDKDAEGDKVQRRVHGTWAHPSPPIWKLRDR